MNQPKVQYLLNHNTIESDGSGIDIITVDTDQGGISIIGETSVDGDTLTIGGEGGAQSKVMEVTQLDFQG